MDGGKTVMTNIILKEGLIYTEVTLTHKNNTVVLKNALVDTGSASTVISKDIADVLELKPEPTDVINSVQGVGGSESVIEKKIDIIKLDGTEMFEFYIQVGAMDYGIELEAIIGLDLLTACHAIMDLNNFILSTPEG